MYTFDTPDPIHAVVEFGAGQVRVNASERDQTQVEVHPTDIAREDDTDLAQQTEVEYDDGRLIVRVPREGGRRWSAKKPPSIEVLIALPAESRLDVDGLFGSIRGQGSLGETDVRTSHGDIDLEETGALRVRSEQGNVSVNQVAGLTDIATNGTVRIGSAHGEATIATANGDVTIDRAQADLEVKADHGAVRIGRLAGGSAVLETGYGHVSIGVPRSTAAEADLNSRYGEIRDQLATPIHAEGTAKIRVRTNYGDIDLYRS